jgi:hypothetical protein
MVVCDFHGKDSANFVRATIRVTSIVTEHKTITVVKDACKEHKLDALKFVTEFMSPRPNKPVNVTIEAID